jgi:TonB-dependent SusC/RagA subfamily outer membrane receptor
MRKKALRSALRSTFLTNQLKLAMKLTTLLLFLGCMQVMATGYAQQHISLQLKETSIKKLFQEVEKQTNYRFVYHSETVNLSKKISVQAEEASLEEVLKQAFAGTSLHFKMQGSDLVVVFADAEASNRQERILTGRITDEQGAPLTHVTVRVPGTTHGTISSANGTFQLAIPASASVLEFTLMGYAKQTILLSNQVALQVEMKRDTRELNSVTVTGYTNYNRSQSASATSTVGADKINQVPMPTLDHILQGRVAGLNVSASSGQPGTSPSVIIRGVGTISGSNAVLYVLDGIPVEAAYMQTINPGDVETVTVLKDASAKALYGSRGSNGVIVINTKKGRAGKLQVDYSSQYGTNQLTKSHYGVMNATERLLFEEKVGMVHGEDIGPGCEHLKSL